jgi:energy-converting hydrogenase B subunit Q
MGEQIGVLVEADTGPGILHKLTGVIAGHGVNITSVDIIEARQTYFELEAAGFELEAADEATALIDDLSKLSIVRRVTRVKTFQTVFGKRIIIIGGGAQVGQVAIGAISEADRHNIRGEHISVDTIPLVGEQALADAVRACARLPRMKALVLAGSLMGGDIERAVREVRAQGLMVVSLNMAGSVPAAADLVVTDPLQAGVMTVMAVAETAKFSLARLKRRVF